jgi:ABC-type Fe3+-hydroxamate transport system substrate-binding protein
VPPQRLVSLVPSITESLLHWGIDVAACTRFCEQPQLVHVGGTKDPHIAEIVALAPDLVLLDREENRREDSEALQAAGLAIHVTHVTSLGDVEPMLDELAARVGHRRSDDEVVAGRSWASVPASPRRTAFVPIWRRPWMTIGAATYGASFLDALGVATVPSSSDDLYPTVELADIAALAPDVVLLPSEPYSFAQRHVEELQRAVPGVPVVPVDGQDLFWWGTRTSAALTRFREVLREVSWSP